jgi:hypothetical protein
LPIAVTYHPPGVELVIRSGDGIFKGKINAAHTKMTGTIILEGRSIGLTIQRVDPSSDAPKAVTQKSAAK